MLLYQSPVVSSSPFLSLTIDPCGATMATGTANGKVTHSPAYSCSHHLTVCPSLLR